MITISLVAVAFVAGVFSSTTVKSWFSTKATAVETAVKADEAKVVAEVKAKV